MTAMTMAIEEEEEEVTEKEEEEVTEKEDQKKKKDLITTGTNMHLLIMACLMMTSLKVIEMLIQMFLNNRLQKHSERPTKMEKDSFPIRNS